MIAVIDDESFVGFEETAARYCVRVAAFVPFEKVPNGISAGTSIDVPSGILCVLPNVKSGLQVGTVDVIALVEQCEHARDSQHIRAARDVTAPRRRLPFRKFGINLTP